MTPLSPPARMRRSARGRWTACLAAALLPAAALQAQTQAAPALPAVQSVIVTGNPLGRDPATQAASVLSGDALAQRRASSLGLTLDGLPGVSATGFGPNASRPVIRGLDGDRVRLLDNGGAAVDASSLSFDHAAASDPLITERIEVLRGPSALLYGGNATGGVVNSIDNRIPRSAALAPFTGRAEIRLGGAALERAAAVVLEGGRVPGAATGAAADGGLAWHLDAFGQRSANLRVPRFAPLAEGGRLAESTRVRNSAARGQGGAIGASWVADSGYVGASVEASDKRYGVTVDPEVEIGMQRQRSSLAGEWRLGSDVLGGWMTKVAAQASRTRYHHAEFDAEGRAGTTFRSRGEETRWQLQHRSLLGWTGVWGLQTEQLEFSALGDEAFVPATRSRSQALFAVEERGLGAWLLSAGLRAEAARVASAGDATGASAATRFGPAQERGFKPLSASLGLRQAAGPGWRLSFDLGHTERAPAYYELFAHGVHVATAAYEQGDPALGVERSRHAEFGAAWSGTAAAFKAHVFETRFSRFLSLDASDERAAGLPVYRFLAVRARLRGFEIEARSRLWQGQDAAPAESAPASAWRLEASASVDAVQGDNLDSGQPLPRLAPWRGRLALEAAGGGLVDLRAGVVLRLAARQARVPATDQATAGSALLDLWAGGRLDRAQDTRWFLRLSNLGDVLARSATTVATMRGLSPLPGRGLTAGLHSRF